MRGPKPPTIALTGDERRDLEARIRRHTTAEQIALRARMIIAAANGQNNSQIAQALGVHVETVRLWRTRWLGLHTVSREDLPIAKRLTDAPRPGTPPRITAEQVCQVVELRCAAREESGRPISQ